MSLELGGLSMDPYRKAFEMMAIFTETDVSGVITAVNERFCAVSGYRAEELLGQNHRMLKSGVHPPEFYERMWQSLREQGLWQGDLCNRRKDGSLYWVASTLVALPDEATGGIRGYAAIRFDVSERYEVRGLSGSPDYLDRLTGLPNRTALQACFEGFVDRGAMPAGLSALCVVDIDRFSEVNAVHGHDLGDRVLREMGQRAQAYAHDEIAWVFHWGGDEFVLLLHGMGSTEQMRAWLQGLLDHLAQPLHLPGLDLSVTCSAGVSEFKADRISPDLLLRHSNLALYKAKSMGRRSIVVYGRDVFQQEQRDGMLQRELRRAMLEGHLQVYYQPKLDLRSGRVLGAEALLRWMDPQRGLVPPLDFLPRIENLPVALEIDEWVLQQALQFLQAHFSGIPDFCVSVNISARQFQSPGFPARLKLLLDAHPGVTWHQLELEILESTAIEDFEQVEQNIVAIKGMGVGVALDDFGVGYSSLAYLKKISPQTLKIDKTFILGILLHEDDLILTQSILGLSRSLHVGVVAEGVETQEHMMLLARIGCTVVQGYGVLRPVAAAPAAGPGQQSLAARLESQTPLPAGRGPGLPGLAGAAGTVGAGTGARAGAGLAQSGAVGPGTGAGR
jgi:diguanylate cyclase (GGDEF)-like protein/PAS domain S-box-containing protein